MRGWRAVRFLVEKEFRQVFRDKAMLRMLFFMPIIQLFLFGYAVQTDIKYIRLATLDYDRTPDSRRLIESFYAGGYFVPAEPVFTPADIELTIVEGKADVAIWIPKGYTESLIRNEPAQVGVVVDGQNSSIAGRARGYAEAIIRREAFRRMDELRSQYPQLDAQSRRVESIARFYYNPELESRFYMIPGIVVLIILVISGMMTGMAVVREKEIGTLEQLLVTPLTGVQIILGKTIPFVILSFVELTFAATIATLYFKLPFEGSVWLLALTSFVFLLVTLGTGLLASTVSSTQQQAMFTVWFILVFGIIMSGFFYPVENMPRSVRMLTYLNPLRYFIAIVRGIFLKGVAFPDIIHNLIPMFLIGVSVFLFAVLRFRKRVS